MTTSKYHRATCPARQHAIKKLLMPGRRGAKDTIQDLAEAKQSVERAIELQAERRKVRK